MDSVRIFVFENTGAGKFRHFNEDDSLRLAWIGEVDHDPSESDDDICERVFSLLNDDERPNRKIRPALSVGDIITIFGNGRDSSHAVDVTGFHKLDELRTASTADIVGFQSELEEA